MQITIPLKTLKSMVEAVKAATPDKSPPQEILTNFRIEARNELFTITATDLKLWLVRREDSKAIKEEGAIAVNAKRFSDAVRSLAGEDVLIKVSEGMAQIKCGKSKFDLPVIGVENYPEIPRNTGTSTFAIATDILRDGIAATLKTVSTDETRVTLTGVHIDECDETLEGEDEPTHFVRFTSTDGQRGSTVRFVSRPLDSLSVTIPIRALKEIEHINETETAISLVNNHIRFDSHALTVISPVVDKAFPPLWAMLTQLRKQKLSGSVKCDRKELIASLKRVNSLSEGDIYVQTVDITIEGDEMKFVSNIGGVGGVEESLPCDVGSGKFRSLFNPKYLLYILDTTKAKYVKLEGYDGTQRCVFISPCDGTDHETFLMAKAVVGKRMEDNEDDED